MTFTRSTITLACFALLAATAPAQAPVVDIDYHQHLKLWRAQKRIVAAYEDVEEAEVAGDGQGAHTKNARDLLAQAAKELKLAAKDTARKH